VTEPTLLPTEAAVPAATPAGLPAPAVPVIVSTFDTGTDGADAMKDHEGYTSVSFTSIPEDAHDRLKAVARQRGVHSRDLIADAIRNLLDERRAGPVTDLASRKGGVRRALWIEDGLVAEMKAVAAADNVNQTEFFLHALRRCARREGLGIEAWRPGPGVRRPARRRPEPLHPVARAPGPPPVQYPAQTFRRPRQRPLQNASQQFLAVEQFLRQIQGLRSAIGRRLLRDNLPGNVPVRQRPRPGNIFGDAMRNPTGYAPGSPGPMAATRRAASSGVQPTRSSGVSPRRRGAQSIAPAAVRAHSTAAGRSAKARTSRPVPAWLTPHRSAGATARWTASAPIR